MKSKLYEFRFSASYLGGKAIIKAIDEKAAWSALQKAYKYLEPLEKCRVTELQDRDGVIYLDDGDY